MKTLLIILCLALPAAVHAAGTLQADANGNAVQGGAPNGYQSQLLTVYSVTLDMSNNVWWSLYPPTACKVRIMPTSAKGAYPAFTVPVTTHISRYVNKNTPFINFTGCTNGELQRQ